MKHLMTLLILCGFALLLPQLPATAADIPAGPMTPIPDSGLLEEEENYEQAADSTANGDMTPNPEVTQTASCSFMSGRDAMYPDGLTAFQAGDYPEASLHFVREAGQDDPRAAYMLGYMQKNGLFLDQDYTAARDWFERSAALGNTAAAAELAVQRYYGLAGFKAEPDAAAKDLTDLMEQQPLAGYLLGKLRLGADPAGAIVPLRRAAEAGHLPAAGLLAIAWCNSTPDQRTRTGLTRADLLGLIATANLPLSQQRSTWLAQPCADLQQLTDGELAAAASDGARLSRAFKSTDLFW